MLKNESGYHLDGKTAERLRTGCLYVKPGVLGKVFSHTFKIDNSAA